MLLEVRTGRQDNIHFQNGQNRDPIGTYSGDVAYKGVTETASNLINLCNTSQVLIPNRENTSQCVVWNDMLRRNKLAEHGIQEVLEWGPDIYSKALLQLQHTT